MVELEEKERRTFYLPVVLMDRVEATCREEGLALSRMVSKGLERQLERYEAIRMLSEKAVS